MDNPKGENMEYGELTPHKSINNYIYACLDVINIDDHKKIVKKFQDKKMNLDQLMNLFRELLVGAYLQTKQLNVRYDKKLQSKTPDWAIYDENNNLAGIVEVATFNIDMTSLNHIKEQLETRGRVVYWQGENKDNHLRIQQSIETKTTKYKELTDILKVPYIVSIFISFEIEFDDDEIEEILYNKSSGIFTHHKNISGVLIFSDNQNVYKFKYFKNNESTYPYEIENGGITV